MSKKCPKDNDVFRTSGNEFIYHPKEFNVIHFVMKEFPNYKWCINQAVRIGNESIKPDLQLVLSDRIIFIEIDENKHKYYDNQNEKNRMIKLCNEMYYKNVFMIRFNPDDYIDGDKYVASCWGKKNNNKLYVCDKTQWNFRLDKLKKIVVECINGECTEPIEVIFLF